MPKVTPKTLAELLESLGNATVSQGGHVLTEDELETLRRAPEISAALAAHKATSSAAPKKSVWTMLGGAGSKGPGTAAPRIPLPPTPAPVQASLAELPTSELERIRAMLAGGAPMPAEAPRTRMPAPSAAPAVRQPQQGGGLWGMLRAGLMAFGGQRVREKVGTIWGAVTGQPGKAAVEEAAGPSVNAMLGMAKAGAAGGGAAGAAGAVGAVAGIGAAAIGASVGIIKFARALDSSTDSLMERRADLSRYSGTIAAATTQLEYTRIRMAARTAAQIGPTTRMAGEARQVSMAAWQPIEADLAQLRDLLSTIGSYFSTVVAVAVRIEPAMQLLHAALNKWLGKADQQDTMADIAALRAITGIAAPANLNPRHEDIRPDNAGAAAIRGANILRRRGKFGMQ